MKQAEAISGVVTIPGYLSQEKLDALRDKIEAMYSGTMNAHKTMIIGKYHQLSAGPVGAWVNSKAAEPEPIFEPVPTGRYIEIDEEPGERCE